LREGLGREFYIRARDIGSRGPLAPLARLVRYLAQNYSLQVYRLAMATHPQIVTDQSIKQLHTLSAILAAQIQESNSMETPLPIERRICKKCC
jgi:hypothetical protein